MSASQKIAEKADVNLATQLVEILPKLLEPDSTTIEQATESFRKLSDNEAFLPTLTQIMISQDQNVQPHTKQLAAVLFRRRILKKWESFPNDMKVLVRQASIEYLSSADNLLYKSLAEIVAGIAKYELSSEAGWPDLINVLQQSTNNSNSYADRLKGTELLKCVCNSAADPLQADNMMPGMLNLFNELLQATDIAAGNSEAGQSVHKNVLDSIQPVLHFMEDKFMSQAQVMLPRLINVIDQMVEWDEQLGGEVLGMFTELCEIECSNYVTIEAAKEMAQTCLKIAINTNYEEDTRASALMQLQMIIKYKRKTFIKFDLIEPLCVEMQKLIVSDEDPDDGIMSGVDGDRTVYTSALQVIDQLAMYVPAEKIIGSLANNISGLLKESVPNSQRAGLLILSVIVEGCADLIMLNYMDDLVPMVCQHLTNAEGSVRSAAYFALGQFSEHLQPDIADYAEQVMPQLMTVISAGPTSPEFQNRDVITKIYYALETFVESLGGKPGGIDSYINPLMSELVGSLVNNENLSVHLLECIVGSIGAVATASDEKFIPFLQQTVEILQKYFPNEEKLNEYEQKLLKAEEEGEKLNEEDDRFQLWSRALVTLSCICRAVGAEAFRPYASVTLEMAVTLSEANDDPDIKASAFSLFAALSAVLKEEMQPHMQTITDILFLALAEEVLDFNGDQSDADRVKQMANILEISREGENVDEDADGTDAIDLEDLENLNVETGPIESKVTALETLCEMSENCTTAFGPYLEKAYKEALSVATLEGSLHDEILRSSLTSCLIFSSQMYKFGEENNDNNAKTLAKELCSEIWPMALDTITDTADRTVCMSVLYNLEKSIQIIGKDIFQEQIILQRVMETVLKVLSDKAACQESEEDTGEEDQAEHDQLLIEYACDILPTTCNAIGGDNFKPIWEGFYPVLMKRANNKKAGTTRAAALGAIADIMKASGKDLAKVCVNDLIGTYMHCLSNKENNVRNNAIYGLGVLVSLGIEACANKYPEVLQAFWKILANEKTDTVRDQVLGAVGRMVLAANSNQNVNVPVDPMVEGLLKALPIKADPMELAPVVLALENYIPKISENDLTNILKNISNIVGLFGKNLEDETRIAITCFMKRVDSDRGNMLGCLDEAERGAIEQARLGEVA